jgi:D-threo-aldose 1-dehydrogenase
MVVSRRILGRTGLSVPRLVFGATSLGNLFRALPDATKHEIVKAWVENVEAPIVIDSAGKYGAGLSLEVIGRELAVLAIDPADVIISNKLAWRRTPLSTPEPTFEPGAWFDIRHDAVQDIGYDGILRCWEEGDQLLGNYHAQLVSVHDPDEYLAAASDRADRERRLQHIIDAYRALTELRAAGKVAGVGVGAKNWKIIQELDGYCDFDWVMFANSYTLMNHPPELVNLFSSLAERKVGIINSALFHGGFLTGGKFFDYRLIDATEPLDRERLEWREKFWNVCKHFCVSAFDVGVAFGLSHPGVTSVALSSGQPERVQSHVLSVERRIPADFWQAMRREGLLRDDYPFL